MIAVDTNVLVHAHREESPKHAAAYARIVALAEGKFPWAIPVFCLAEFLRIITHPRVFDPPHSVKEAVTALQRLLKSPSLAVLVPGPRFAELLIDAVLEAEALGNLVFDAQVVAVCREGGVGRLITEDRDFDRFKDFATERL